MSECRHLHCHCEVEPTAEFCSAYCANAHGSDVEHGACACAHQRCEDLTRAAYRHEEEGATAALGHRTDAVSGDDGPGD